MSMHSKMKFLDRSKMHRPGIEPGPPAWQASILPLNHRCLAEIRAASFPPQTPQPPCDDYDVTAIVCDKARFCARCQPWPFSSNALRHRAGSLKPALGPQVRHRCFSGIMLACHAGGPGSFPGRCILLLDRAIVI